MDDRRFVPIMRRLLLEIATRKVQPGEPLPKEADLAERFACSRGVAREALRGLELCGAIGVRHGLGSTVRPLREWNALNPLVIEALIASPSGRAFAATYLDYATQFVFFVALHDLTHGDTATARGALSAADQANDPGHSDAAALAGLLSNWGGGSDGLRRTAADALATAVLLAGDRHVLDGALLRARRELLRGATAAAAAGAVEELIELLRRAVDGGR